MNLTPVYERFKTQRECILYLEGIFWEGSPVCPFCSYKKYNTIKKENRYRCKSCKSPFSVTVLTLFHKTKVDLQKWFFSISNDHLTCRKLATQIGVTKDTAHFMLQRISVARREIPEIINKIKKEVYEQYY